MNFSIGLFLFQFISVISAARLPVNFGRRSSDGLAQSIVQAALQPISRVTGQLLGQPAPPVIVQPQFVAQPAVRKPIPQYVNVGGPTPTPQFVGQPAIQVVGPSNPQIVGQHIPQIVGQPYVNTGNRVVGQPIPQIVGQPYVNNGNRVVGQPIPQYIIPQEFPYGKKRKSKSGDGQTWG